LPHCPYQAIINITNKRAWTNPTRTRGSGKPYTANKESPRRSVSVSLIIPAVLEIYQISSARIKAIASLYFYFFSFLLTIPNLRKCI
jgi:hypothetical protein